MDGTLMQLVAHLFALSQENDALRAENERLQMALVKASATRPEPTSESAPNDG